MLNDGEEVVLDLRPHWMYLAPATFFLLVAIVVGILAAVKVDGDAGTAASIAALVLVVAAVLYFVYRYVNWVTTMFVLTTDRIITRRGHPVASPASRSRSSGSTPCSSTSGSSSASSGAATSSIESAGERGTEHFTDIRKPALVQREIYVQMEDNENRKFDRVRRPGRRGLALDGRAAREAPRPRPAGRASRPSSSRPRRRSCSDREPRGAGRQPRPVGHRDAAGLGGPAGGLHPVLRAARPAGTSAAPRTPTSPPSSSSRPTSS